MLNQQIFLNLRHVMIASHLRYCIIHIVFWQCNIVTEHRQVSKYED